MAKRSPFKEEVELLKWNTKRIKQGKVTFLSDHLGPPWYDNGFVFEGSQSGEGHARLCKKMLISKDSLDHKMSNDEQESNSCKQNETKDMEEWF